LDILLHFQNEMFSELNVCSVCELCFQFDSKQMNVNLVTFLVTTVSVWAKEMEKKYTFSNEKVLWPLLKQT